MSELAAILQAVAWPALVASLFYWFRAEIVRALRAFMDRVEQGDLVEADTSGLKLARPPIEGSVSAPVQAPPVQVPPSDIVPHPIYLVHAARRNSSLDKSLREYYPIRAWIDADYLDLLGQVKSVTYYLHPDLSNPVREIADRESGLALATAAWGAVTG